MGSPNRLLANSSIFFPNMPKEQSTSDQSGESWLTYGVNFVLDVIESIRDFIFVVVLPTIVYVLYNATLPYVMIFNFVKGLCLIPYLSVVSTTLYLRLLSRFLRSIKEDEISVRNIATLMRKIETLLKNIYQVLLKNDNQQIRPIPSRLPKPDAKDKSTAAFPKNLINVGKASSTATEDSTTSSDLLSSDIENGGIGMVNGPSEKEKLNVDEKKSKETVGVDETDKKLQLKDKKLDAMDKKLDQTDKKSSDIIETTAVSEYSYQQPEMNWAERTRS